MRVYKTAPLNFDIMHDLKEWRRSLEILRESEILSQREWAQLCRLSYIRLDRVIKNQEIKKKYYKKSLLRRRLGVLCDILSYVFMILSFMFFILVLFEVTK